ncbi:MAG: hypothetical protein KGJ93_00065 [Patescibacteria group bacterium]|nr:hypothetical protein [Patescibacteria group bacterium]
MTNFKSTIFAACLAAAMFVFFATAAVAQTPVPQGCFLLQTGQTFCPVQPSAPTPAPTATSSAAQLRTAISEAQDINRQLQAVQQPGVPWPMFWSIAFIIVLLAVIAGIYVWWLSQHHPTIRTSIRPADGQAQVNFVPVLPPPPAPAPAPAPAPLPAGTPAPGNCGTCGTAYPAAARFCAACGRVLPLVLFALLLFGFSHTAMAQQNNEVRYACVVNGVPGFCSQPPAATPAPASAPAAPAPPAPAPRRHIAAPASAPAASTPQQQVEAITRGVIQALREQGVVAPATSPKPTASSLSEVTQEVADRISAVETRQNMITNQQNMIGNRLGGVEADLKRVGDYANKVGELSAATAAGAIPKMSEKGGGNSPACRAYQALQAVAGEVSGRAPRGCK